MPFAQLSNACPRSYGSIGPINGQAEDDQGWHRGEGLRFSSADCESQRTREGPPMSFLSSQSSSRNTRVFGAVVASLAVCCVMVGLYNSSSPAAAQAIESKKYGNLAKSGRYLVLPADQEKGEAAEPKEKGKAAAKAVPAKKPSQDEKEAGRSEPVKKAAEEKEAPEKKAAVNKPAKGGQEEEEKNAVSNSYERAAKHHQAAASHYEKIAEDIEKKARSAEREADAEFSRGMKKLKALERQAGKTAQAELKEVKANKKLLNSKWESKFEDPSNWA